MSAINLTDFDTDKLKTTIKDFDKISDTLSTIYLYLGRLVKIYTEEDEDYFEGLLRSIESRYEDKKEACNVNDLQTTIILNMLLLNGTDEKEIQIEANAVKKIELV